MLHRLLCSFALAWITIASVSANIFQGLQSCPEYDAFVLGDGSACNERMNFLTRNPNQIASIEDVEDFCFPSGLNCSLSLAEARPSILNACPDFESSSTPTLFQRSAAVCSLNVDGDLCLSNAESLMTTDLSNPTEEEREKICSDCTRDIIETFVPDALLQWKDICEEPSAAFSTSSTTFVFILPVIILAIWFA
jgi:hypothetical protein